MRHWGDVSHDRLKVLGVVYNQWTRFRPSQLALSLFLSRNAYDSRPTNAMRPTLFLLALIAGTAVQASWFGGDNHNNQPAGTAISALSHRVPSEAHLKFLRIYHMVGPGTPKLARRAQRSLPIQHTIAS